MSEERLESLVLKLLPNIDIFIIRGFDEFSKEAYIQNAYFDKKQAEHEMTNIPKNGTGDVSDTYYLIETTIDNLYNNSIYDQRTEQSLDDIDIRLAFMYLSENSKK